MFQYTTAVDKLRNTTKPIKVIQGGTSAGKTEGIIANLIDQCTRNKEMDLTVVAESIPAIKDGALKIFKNTMRSTGRWCDDHYNATDRLYSFSNGAKAQFKSFDTIGKAKAAGKRTHLFVNECQYVPWPIVDALMVRTFKEIWLDYNPNNPFWVQDEIIGRDDAELLILTYADNEATPQKVLNDFERKKQKAFHDPESSWEDETNIKSKYHANWCKVYIRGELGSLEGVVYQNWHIVDHVPSVGLVGYGLDFGYVNPCAWIAGYEVDGIRIFDEVIYEPGLTNPSLSQKMKERGNTNVWTYADSAEPKSIDELYSYGIKIKGAKKGADSVGFGIGILQEKPFAVTSRSINLIKELREYMWDTDRDGTKLDKPVKENDHACDAIRYLASEQLSISNRPRPQPRITISGFH